MDLRVGYVGGDGFMFLVFVMCASGLGGGMEGD